MDLGLKGKRAAVAAGSAGLGLETARCLLAEGVSVAICGRNQDRLEAAAADLGEPGNVVTIQTDLSDPSEAENFVARATQALGGLEILVANAGGPPPGTVATTEMDAYSDAINMNLLSTIAMCREALAPMRAAGWGRIAAITSIGVRQPVPSLVASVTARAGVTGFLKVLASEVASEGICVNSIQPGIHRTDRLKSLSGNDLANLTADVPMGRPGEAADFGAVVTFLCSEQAQFITGASLVVDGGASKALY